VSYLSSPLFHFSVYDGIGDNGKRGRRRRNHQGGSSPPLFHHLTPPLGKQSHRLFFFTFLLNAQIRREREKKGEEGSKRRAAVPSTLLFRTSFPLFLRRPLPPLYPSSFVKKRKEGRGEGRREGSLPFYLLHPFLITSVLFFGRYASLLPFVSVSTA